MFGRVFIIPTTDQNVQREGMLSRLFESDVMQDENPYCRPGSCDIDPEVIRHIANAHNAGKESALFHPGFSPETGAGAEVEPDRIIFNDPATVVFWNDGTKTVVKCTKGDAFSPAAGFALCYMKKTMGEKAYRETLKVVYEAEKALDQAKQAAEAAKKEIESAKQENPAKQEKQAKPAKPARQARQAKPAKSGRKKSVKQA